LPRSLRSQHPLCSLCSLRAVRAHRPLRVGECLWDAPTERRADHEGGRQRRPPATMTVLR
jgi:hypothetical protein